MNLTLMELNATSSAYLNRYELSSYQESAYHMYVGGMSVQVSTTMRRQYVHTAQCCNEGVMFLPLIYPDYTMECESLLMEPCVPPLHLSICLFTYSDRCRNFYCIFCWPDMRQSKQNQQPCKVI